MSKEISEKIPRMDFLRQSPRKTYDEHILLIAIKHIVSSSYLQGSTRTAASLPSLLKQLLKDSRNLTFCPNER